MVKDAKPKAADTRSSCRLPDQTRQAVVQYYEDDSISYQCPGIKECRKMQVNGAVLEVPVRYMTVTLKEAHSLFLQEHELSISFSKFASLRPVFVLLQGNTLHNVCTCVLHENIRFILRALHSKGVPINTEFKDFIAQVTCNQESTQCMKSECPLSPGISLIELPDDLANQSCEWRCWGIENKRAILKTKEGLVLDCLKDLDDSLVRFLKHTFVKRQQSKAFKDARQNVTTNALVIQVDFAENYSCKYQNEIQSAHWTNKMVSIFTAVVWYRQQQDGDIITKSFALVSDCTDHDKYSVHVALKTLLGQIFTFIPDIQNMIFFSDGAASQFKQKYTLCNITYLAEEFNVSMEWNFFESYHGKDVDAIGGLVKKMVWAAVRSGKKVMNTSEFMSVCKNIYIEDLIGRSE